MSFLHSILSVISCCSKAAERKRGFMCFCFNFIILTAGKAQALYFITTFFPKKHSKGLFILTSIKHERILKFRLYHTSHIGCCVFIFCCCCGSWCQGILLDKMCFLVTDRRLMMCFLWGHRLTTVIIYHTLNQHHHIHSTRLHLHIFTDLSNCAQ